MAASDDAALPLTMSRRDTLRACMAATALPILHSACNNGPKYGPPGDQDDPGPQPVLELTDGRSLYDDFDGHGNLQTYDGRNLAEPCLLSERIWGAKVGYEVLDGADQGQDPVALNEDGQRIEYRRQERMVEEIIGFIRQNPRPILGWERDILDGWLNDRGRALTAGLEARPVESQLKVVRCLLDRRGELFNERGRELARLLAGGGPNGPPGAEVACLVEKGYGEAEVLLLARLAAEREQFERFRRSPLQGMIREGESLLGAVTGIRRDIGETAYIYDPAGRLVDAEPHIPGRPYRGTRRLALPESVGSSPSKSRMPLSDSAESARGRGEVVPSVRRGGCVLRVTNPVQPYIKMLLNNPEILDPQDFGSFSADVLLSSASSGRLASAGLDYHTTIPEQELGRSWYAQIVIVGGESEVYIMGHYTNINTGVYQGRKLGSAAFDTWTNLRLDILTAEDDPALGADAMRLDFYVDGVFKASLFPEDSPILLDPERTGLGPHRSLIVYAAKGTSNAVGFFDNVRAVYENRIS